VPKHFIEKGFNRLVLDGAIYLVTKRKTRYVNKLQSVFGGARVHESGSYFFFVASKKSFTYASRELREAQLNWPKRPCGVTSERRMKGLRMRRGYSR
jgi:hypothetical protein